MVPMDGSSGIDIGTGLTAAAAEITSQVSAALPIALTVAGAIVAVSIAWRLFKRFSRG